MQKLAAYILERTEGLQRREDRKAEGERIRAVIEAWLKSKGSSSVEEIGTYSAVDGSDASYRVMSASDDDRSWTMFELAEVTQEGRRFITTVSVTVGGKNVVVFVTMEVGSVSTLITRFEVDPKCPKVIRDLMAQPGTWYHGASRLRFLSQVEGFDAGELLALEIQAPDRTIPFVVVSKLDGQTVLRALDEKLANDLAGVANVYTVDEDASWALTDILRKPFSCYGGAIRIYWPRLSAQDDPYRHHLWTAPRLRGLEGDERFALERIRRQVRTFIMRASAASVVRPAEIDDIRGASARAEYAALQAKATELEQLKAKASSLEEFKELATLFSVDKDNLLRELSVRNGELEQQRSEIQRLESDKQALIFQLDQAKARSGDPGEVEPDTPDQEDGEQAPVSGEVRFYKKRFDARTHDVLIRATDCGHNAWQSAARADKARKGIARLEGGNREWKTMQHCGSCTKGGMWRVQW